MLAQQMLGIPFKKMEKCTELVGSLAHFIGVHFGEAVDQEHREALSDLQQLREDIRIVQEKSEVNRDKHMRYLALLSSIESRFPISESNVRVQFVWYDLFKGKKVGRYSIHYEKAGILFNLAALQSQIAALQNRSEEVGLKKATYYYRCAAGTLNYLKNYLASHPGESVTADLTNDALSIFINFMLGHAQECFLEKAIPSGMKSIALYKLAAQAAEYYDLASNLLGLSALKATIDKIWMEQALLRGSYYKALAHYHSSIVSGEAKKYGHVVMHLQKAANHLNKKGIPPLIKRHLGFNDAFNRLREIVAKALNVAEKDNSTIYHQLVPSEDVALEKKSLVEPVEFSPLQLTSENDPFYKLVPFAIHQAASIYNEKKAELIRNELRAIDEHNEIAKSSLFSMNLPGAIQAYESPTGLPQSLKEKIQTVQSKGGFHRLRELHDILQQTSREGVEILNNVVNILDAEQADDLAHHTTYGETLWQRTPSQTLTSSLRQDEEKYRKNLALAQKSDTYVQQKLKDNEELLARLSGSLDDISASLPANNDIDTTNHQVLNELKQTVMKLDTLVSTRTALHSQLKFLAEKDDITAALFGATKPQDDIFQEELKKYQTLQDQLRTNFTQQEKTLEQISTLNDRFLEIKRTSTQAKEREEALQQLDFAHKTFFELESNLREGIQFYRTLQERLTVLKRKCEDFVFARNTEKQDLLSAITPIKAHTSAATASSQTSQLDDEFVQRFQQTELEAQSQSQISQSQNRTQQPQVQLLHHLPQTQFQHFQTPPPPYPGFVGQPPPYHQPFLQLPPGFVPAQYYIPQPHDPNFKFS